MATLISFSGRPGVGKTTVARALLKQIKAVYLRVDSIEAAMKNSSLKIHPAEEAGYLVVAAVAEDNLALGFDVVADTVNPVDISRQLWVDAAAAANAELINVEIVCSDKLEHRRRVEARISDIDGLTVPGWKDVATRQYEPWTQERLMLDTGQLSVAECTSKIICALKLLS